MTPENAVKSACIDFLQYRGWVVMRINSGAATGDHKGKRRFVPFVRWFCLGRKSATAGVSDIIAIKPGMAPLAVETKAPGKLADVSAAQKEFGQEWQAHGGLWLVVDNVGMLIGIFND